MVKRVQVKTAPSTDKARKRIKLRTRKEGRNSSKYYQRKEK
jgi:hypothetical protein